uniref:Ymf75 n=1 Tax=Tetrahymena thermophila TaxID=5911 RepID=Q951A7_TETTH|nr:ymf75 [Tetrahymena thermophila]7W5Z_Y5 Chain Y5, Ymf75 [Tetrahymena thermophila]7W5Z_y5 Chain y5, Ymf75 [Tetrahymena thermophila]8B6H_ED Chain ED, Ymf75 [Tetrahymena thermophila SB210]8B6H_Ed Chain Ed, Ymf75 [Tetrahymena thermophila SB210]8BQS_ED Chain ED, Ymf75 [Tetrahymena thermophila SB210]8BQS_Ed Chain Ed, Ymf75 [Tetrahymena thermophila SB210]8GYM_Y5 Chain Y5, Ymf75 [Tetrahymena thermophila SB210]8GYM_y5 Chain y5, Ymf75 [Tetrahymena thermophila SB210]8GZU_0F Chain 0F, Ymf75 [Tetrahy
MFLGIFKDVIKLLNKKVVPVYFWFFLYCFLSTMDTNIFVSSCSFLKVEVFGKDENTTLVLLFYVFYSLFNFYLSRIKNKNNYLVRKHLYTTELLIELILFKYKLIILKFSSIKYILNFNVRKFILFNLFLINNYKAYKINTFFLYIYIYLNNLNIIWYPIFKAYSIFGYYKSTRLNFIDTKNENIKRIKY